MKRYVECKSPPQVLRYEQPKENKWIQPIRKGYKMRCCDCGLVHNIDFRIVKNKRGNFILFKISRNNRATSQIRKNLDGIRFARHKA